MPVLCLLPSFLMLPFQWLFLHLLSEISTQESTDLKSNAVEIPKSVPLLPASFPGHLFAKVMGMDEVFFQEKDSELMISGGFGSGMLQLASTGLWTLVCTPLTYSCPVMLVVWSWLWWVYLDSGNWQTLDPRAVFFGEPGCSSTITTANGQLHGLLKVFLSDPLFIFHASKPWSVQCVKLWYS